MSKSKPCSKATTNSNEILLALLRLVSNCFFGCHAPTLDQTQTCLRCCIQINAVSITCNLKDWLLSHNSIIIAHLKSLCFILVWCMIFYIPWVTVSCSNHFLSLHVFNQLIFCTTSLYRSVSVVDPLPGVSSLGDPGWPVHLVPRPFLSFTEIWLNVLKQKMAAEST